MTIKASVVMFFFLILSLEGLEISPCFRIDLGLTSRVGGEPIAWHGVLGSVNVGFRFADMFKTMIGGEYGTSPFYKKEILPPDVYPPLWEERNIANEKLLYVGFETGKAVGLESKFGYGWWSQTVRYGQGDSLLGTYNREMVATTIGQVSLLYEYRIHFANLALRFNLGVFESGWFKHGSLFVNTKIAFGL